MNPRYPMALTCEREQLGKNFDFMPEARMGSVHLSLEEASDTGSGVSAHMLSKSRVVRDSQMKVMQDLKL